jgi:hypothetical protein
MARQERAIGLGLISGWPRSGQPVTGAGVVTVARRGMRTLA